MTHLGQTTPGSDARSTVPRRRFLVAWSGGLIGAFIAATLVLRAMDRPPRVDADARQWVPLESSVAEPGLAAADAPRASNNRAVEVTAGIYLERIIALSVKEFEWQVEFYVWFRWEGDDIRLEDHFEVVDGAIESVKKERERSDGRSHYELYRVVARITKFFDVTRFPRDDHLLTINIETPAYTRDELVFRADVENSTVSSRVHVPGYAIEKMLTIERPHAYKTGRGDPHVAPGAKTTHSQLQCGILIHRPDAGLYIKMFQALFVALAIALLALFIKPTHVDPRFGLGVGALFAAVANSYITSSLIPDTGALTLADIANGAGIVIILISLVESTISLYLLDHRGDEALSRAFDRISFAILLAGSVALNIALLL